MMHSREKSYPAIVASEAGEQSGLGRGGVGGAKGGGRGNARQQSTRRTQTRAHVTHALDRVRQAAKLRRRSG